MKNTAEAKFLPKSGYTRELALSRAKQLNDELLSNEVLTQRTKDRLNAIEPLYRAAQAEIGMKKTIYMGLIAEKEKVKGETAMLCAHFLQVFCFCVKRGEASVGHKALYGMQGVSDALPSLKREWDIEKVAETIIKGEAYRVAQGGVPMSNPSAAQVEAKQSVFLSLIGQASNAKTELMNAKKALRELNKEANGVIKKIWAEVETFYGERTRENMRKHARDWGVVYARKGNLLTVTGVVTDAAKGLPLAGAKVQFANGRNKVTTNSEGKFTISTTLMHQQPLTAKLKDYDPAEIIVELDSKAVECKMAMVSVG